MRDRGVDLRQRLRRRRLIGSLASLPVLGSLPGIRMARADAPAPPRRRPRPGDPAWPDAAGWQALKEEVGGNLEPGESLFAPCAGGTHDGRCGDAIKYLRNPFFLGEQSGGTQVSGWFEAWTPQPSAYVLAARSAKEIAAAVRYAGQHNLRLVVKGAGHSYLGTSNAPDSLLIWTRAMSEVTLHEAFVPLGCAAGEPGVPAVSAGAGAVWIDLYEVVTRKAGRYVQGGGCTDVGVAGLVQSGGFGNMSKGFGTAAASLLEAEIVTADGQVRTVNRCREPDLFWALKGGGGGSWGVVTRVTLRTHELPQNFGAAWGQVKAASTDAFRRLVAAFVAHYESRLFNPHWGEQIILAPDNTLQISMVCQGLTNAQALDAWQPFFAWVADAGADFKVEHELGARATAARHWWDVAGNDAMMPDSRIGAPPWHGWWTGDQAQVGAYLHAYDSRWLPAALLRQDQQARLVDALVAASRHERVTVHFNKGLAGGTADAILQTRETAMNPAACEAFALAIIANGERPAFPGMLRAPVDQEVARADVHKVEAATAALRAVAPDTGAYVSESNFFDTNWQQDYWGAHYARLRAVKDVYDPQGMFFVHHGVGSEDWSADGFERLRG
jgi:FAD/FMN-containing dehydrogenase